MKLYNTLTRNVAELKPLTPPAVTVYTCGPTVYDYPQIGNWFTYVRWDTLIRALNVAGYSPNWVLNFTDVGHLVSDADEGEDKLEKGARREGKTAWEVAEFYGNDFLEGMQKLHIQTPTHIVKATEHIPEQIALVQSLEAKGYTYVITDGVYFDTAKFPQYADFARLDLDEQQAGARVEHNPEKRNASDFALWKFSPEDQQRDMEWDSPWGKGFPGWHIECSAMSMKYLGETLDIHTGGIDHIPVHHTNEIAQSEAATGKPFANMWLHGNHITVNGEKISKSLGNGVRIQDIEAKGYEPIVVRLHVLESHYRSQSKFSWDSLDAARNRLKDYRALADLRFQAVHGEAQDAAEYFQKQQQAITDALLDDLNTPEALRIVSLVANEQQQITSEALPVFTTFLQFLDDALGLGLLDSKEITEAQKDLIAQRQTARAAKDWAVADRTRNELEVQGIGLRDVSDSSIWYRL